MRVRPDRTSVFIIQCRHWWYSAQSKVKPTRRYLQCKGRLSQVEYRWAQNYTTHTCRHASTMALRWKRRPTPYAATNLLHWVSSFPLLTDQFSFFNSVFFLLTLRHLHGSVASVYLTSDVWTTLKYNHHMLRWFQAPGAYTWREYKLVVCITLTVQNLTRIGNVLVGSQYTQGVQF